jgi:hypothetical protein
MSCNRLLFVVALLACAGAALAIWMIASLDKQGHPRLAGDPAMAVLLLLPYVVLAAVAVWNRQRSIVLAACLAAVTLIAARAIPVLWSDYQAWRREPPGREVQHMGLLAVLFVEWVGSGVLLVAAVGYLLVWAMLRSKNGGKP